MNMTLNDLMAAMAENGYNAIKVRQSKQGCAVMLRRE